MRVVGICAALLAIAMATPALAENREVIYAAPEGWVTPQPTFSDHGANASGAFIMRYSDAQVHLDDQGIEWYSAYRLKILNPEALTAGNVTVVWNPTTGSATVHKLLLYRDGQVIDVLKDNKFAIFQREGGLELSMLDGLLTAHLNIPGLRVGDEIEFADTVRSSEPALAGRNFGMMFLASTPAPGEYRLRVDWAEGHKPAFKLTPEFDKLAKTDAHSLELDFHNPGEIQLPEDAPLRYMLPRRLEFSDFASWSEISHDLAPLYAKASTLAADSPLRGEAAKIAAKYSDPLDRAHAALELVQKSVRYIYVGMDGANLRPADADETWRRRYGDCKADTALLLALLRELGIAAEPVAASSTGGDGINERLPALGGFDHVLLRATIGGKRYWLDGTRSGDSRVLERPVTYYEWFLPLTAAGADLEGMKWQPPKLPQEIAVLDLDATAGTDQPGREKAVTILRGDRGLTMRSALLAMSETDANRVIKSVFNADGDWVEIEDVSWRFDEPTAALVLTATGTARFDWKDDDGDGLERLSIPGAGFYAPPDRHRPAVQDQAAPWANDGDNYKCYVTTVHLPEPKDGQQWSYSADPMDLVIGGIAYWRVSELSGRAMKTVMSRRSMNAEISPAEAERANARIPGFDNNQSMIELKRASGPLPPLVRDAGRATGGEVPTAEGVDWTGTNVPCAAPDLLAY